MTLVLVLPGSCSIPSVPISHESLIRVINHSKVHIHLSQSNGDGKSLYLGTNLVFRHTLSDLIPDLATVYRKYLESTTKRICSVVEYLEMPYRLKPENSEESSMLDARFIEHTSSWSDTREYRQGQRLVKEEFRLPNIKNSCKRIINSLTGHVQTRKILRIL